MTKDERMAPEEIEMRTLCPVRTYREIAHELGVSHGTVQNIERRALAKMARRLSRGDW